MRLRLQLLYWCFLRYLSPKGRFYALLFLALGAVHLQPAATFAQDSPPKATQPRGFSSVLTLTDRQVDYDVAPFTYLTRDEDNRLGTREIYQNHKNNLRGERLGIGPIDLSFDAYAHWMIIDIQNNSRKSDWVLDFGSMAEGRTGIFPRIMVNEGVRDTLLLDGLPRAGALNLGEGLNRHTLPLTILPGQQISLVMYIVPSDHTPTVMVPRLVEASAYLKSANVQNLDMQRIIFWMLIGGTVFFAGNMLLRRGIGFFPHALFLGSQGAWYWLASEKIFTPLPAGAHLPGIATLSGGLLALAVTQSVVASQDKEDGEGIFLYICASFVLMALMAFVFGLPSGSMLRPALVYGIGGFAYFVAFIRALRMQKELQFAGGFLAFAWVLMLVATLLPPMAGFGLLPADVLFLQANWLVMPLVVVLMIISGSLQIRANNLSIIRDVLRQAQRAQALNRMKQSQESADQARLLRVIEREREIMEDLRNRDAERTEEMRLAKIRADEANRAKSAFLAVVSHEIRTPMTGIMGMLRLLQDTQLSTKQREFAYTIKDSGDAMLALLNDILDFSKIEGGGMDIEIIDFDLYRVVNSVVMLMHGHAAAKGITLKSEVPEGTPRYLKGDPTRLRQILLNLVGNAIKFTQSGSVCIHIRPGNQPTNAVPEAPEGTTPIYFGVEDTGIGISPAAQENLFNPFSQADSSIARKFGGTGLGLAICKKLIEAMGSTIKLDSHEGVGTTFYFTLNMALGDASAVVDDGQQNATMLARVMNVLVVDDNPINRKVIEGLLQRDGHLVTCAESGVEALELLHNQPFDLVFMDIEMPGMDGVVTLQNLRASDAACRDVPIVALTGNIGSDDIERYRMAGMRDVLAKPIDPDKMRAVLLAVGGARPMADAGSHFDPNLEDAPQDPTAPLPPEQDIVAEPKHYMLSEDELNEDSFSQSVEFEDPERGFDATELAEMEPEVMEFGVIDPEIVEAEIVEAGVAEGEMGEGKMVESGQSDNALPDSLEQDGLDQNGLEQDGPQDALEQGGQQDSLQPDSPQPDKEMPPSQNVPLLDDAMLQTLRDSLGAENLGDMIASVIEHNAQSLPKLQAAFNDADMDMVGAIAHELKGMNANFGLAAVSHICGRIEHGVRQRSLGMDALDELVFAELPEALQASERVLMGHEGI